MYSFDAYKAVERCVSDTKSWFDSQGDGNCNAVVGISGGKDSTIAAAICVSALGRERVIGILMPNGVQPDIEDAETVIRFLGIKKYLVNIAPMVDYMFNSIIVDVENGLTQQTSDNVPPRIRMSTLYGYSQSLNGRVINTSNLSEIKVGYSTRWGDSTGDYGPLRDYTVTELLQIGKVLGIPDELLYKIPADGLSGRSDEDNLGFTYAVLDKYIRTGEIDNLEVKHEIERRYRANLFKCRDIPCSGSGLGIVALAA